MLEVKVNQNSVLFAHKFKNKNNQIQNVEKPTASAEHFRFLTVTQSYGGAIFKQYLVLIRQETNRYNCNNVKELCLWPQCHQVVTLSKEESFNALQRSTARVQQTRTTAKQSSG